MKAFKAILLMLTLTFCFNAHAESYLCKPYMIASLKSTENGEFHLGTPTIEVLLTTYDNKAQFKFLDGTAETSSDYKEFKIFNKIDEDWFMAYNSWESLVINFDARDKVLTLTKPTSEYSFISYYKCV